MRENKSFQIKVRVTASQKAELDKYAEAAGLNISEAIRLAIEELLRKEAK